MTPFILRGNRERLTAQNVPGGNRKTATSYPHWLFEKNSFMGLFRSHGYALVHELESAINKIQPQGHEILRVHLS